MAELVQCQKMAKPRAGYCLRCVDYDFCACIGAGEIVVCCRSVCLEYPGDTGAVGVVRLIDVDVALAGLREIEKAENWSQSATAMANDVCSEPDRSAFVPSSISTTVVPKCLSPSQRLAELSKLKVIDVVFRP